MQQLTPAGQQAIRDLAQRYAVSIDAVQTLLVAVNAGGGSMAQFYHPDLGGGGQWMRGGMTMVGDMFNSNLQGLVANLCSDLSSLLNSTQVFLPPATPSYGGQSQYQGGNFGGGNNWWPGELGSPSSSGGQNDARYAYFPAARRLAILRNGQVTIYDTLDHQIGGVQQQQGGYAGSLSFSSQFGTFTVDSLPQVSPAPAAPFQAQPQAPTAQSAPAPQYQTASGNASNGLQSHDDIINALERLGSLHQKGVLTDSEFQTKKAELLSRL